MKGNLILAAAMLAAKAASQCTTYEGNWYCAAMDSIFYTSVGGADVYNKVTDMDSSTGACSSTPYQYSGTLAPFNEELSVHIRGPIQLKTFAAYVANPSASDKARRTAHAHRHAHGHSHLHQRHHRKRAVGGEVTATINGQVVSWANEYDGGGAATTAAGLPTTSPDAVPSDPPQESAKSAGTPAKASPTANPDNSVPGSFPDGTNSSSGWTRTAYYDASAGTSQGLVFLNHFGGQGSGVWDSAFGNSLSYATSNGQGGSATSQTLADTVLPSNSEVVIMTDQSCGEDGSCGYYRPGNVAYHGFDGAEKAFFFEFMMPSDGQTNSTSPYVPVNMPAVWLLNAQIPRTLQYGNADCSCWTTGCGEFDVVEVLSPGYVKAKSTVHGNKAGGDSNYFLRPQSAYQKMSLVMSGDNFYIKMLSPDTEFGDLLSSSKINELMSSTAGDSSDTSVFNLANASSG